MQLTPKDISAYIYCPLLQKHNKHKINPLTEFEQYIRQAIKLAEKRLIDTKGKPTPKKLMRAWDKIWWTTVTERNIPPSQAQKDSIRAVKKLTEYCKYDVTTDVTGTIGVDVQSQLNIGSSIITSQIDIIKLRINNNKPNIILIDLTRKEFSKIDIALDPICLINAYMFTKDQDSIVTYVSIDMSDTINSFNIATATYRKQHMKTAKDMLHHIEHGISKKIYYTHPWLCKECKTC